MLPKQLKPIHKYNLIRLGKKNDGGYLVEKESLFNSKGLISFGLNYDWSFEKDFFQNNEVPIHCYDPTVKYSSIKKFSRKYLLKLFNKNYWSITGIKNIIKLFNLSKDYKKFFSKNVVHYQRAIGIGKNLIKLEDVFKNINLSPIFLKIDIEGSEYRILDDIIFFQKHISGLVIEFHNVDLHMSRILDFIRKLNLTLVHIHGQNPGGKDYLDQNQDPIQIEITFSRFNSFLDLKSQIPHELDQPADPRFDEIKLFFDQD
jgi:hypothetical protein